MKIMQMELTQTELVTKSKSFRDAEREQTSILAPLERAALRGLARRMPGWVNSDHLSVLGLVGMLGAGAIQKPAASALWVLCGSHHRYFRGRLPAFRPRALRLYERARCRGGANRL